jgi:hypothetical protein
MIAKLRAPHIMFRVASHCEPPRAVNSAKMRLIKQIAAHELANLDTLTNRKSSTSVVIANVDNSYPESLVYVPDKDELFTVTVRPGTSYIYRVDGLYQFGQVNNRRSVAAIRAKLLKYGLRVQLPR